MSNLAENLNSVGDVKGSPVTPNNLVGLIPNTLYNHIMSFINEFESKNTRTSYENHFRNMFSYMTGKLMEQVNYEDIKLINKQKVKDYRQFLRVKYKTTTINQKIFACKSLWDDLIENNFANNNPFDLKSLKQEENNHGSLTYEEVQNLFDFCLQLNYKPMTQKLYFEFLFVVTCRKHVAQTLTWDQIVRELDIDSKKMVWVVNFTGENRDKGKNIKKAITNEFYNQLRENYEAEQCKNNKVFCGIYNSTYDNTLKAFCKEFDIDPNRGIVQHSLKSSGLDYIQGVIGDINVTAQAAQHSNIQTTYNRYLNKNKKYSSQPSYMLYKNFSIDMLKDLSKEDLLILIEKAGKETIAKLCLEMNK